jgi:SH3-like domain-containing protein
MPNHQRIALGQRKVVSTPRLRYRRVTVEAQNAFEAKAKLEAMCGAGKVISVHKA